MLCSEDLKHLRLSQSGKRIFLQHLFPTKKQRMVRKLLLTLSVVLSAIVGAMAQGVTTGSITGKVVDSKDEGLPGANVVAVHTPSGTTYGTASRPDGRFTIPNARVGGPYKITVSFIGYESQEKSDVIVSLGEAADLSFKLAESGTQLQEVQIFSTPDAVFSSERTGAMTNISNTQITQLPTLSRSITDYLRLTPQASVNSFGTTNFGGRSDLYNNMTIDGALFNNAFGLSGAVGGQASAQPISLDAVDQVTASIAPYDVTQGSFTGAGVNVVTRSGTNDFQGSVYGFTRSQNLVGSQIRGVENKYSNFNFNNVGFRLGGPLIKNKLFFFANYERERQEVPGTTFSATRNGNSGSTVSAVKASDLDSLQNFLVEKYGYNPGGYEGYKLQQNNDKGTFKLDWNISQKHKFSIKYNYLKSYKDVPPSSSGAIGTRSPSNTGLPFLGAYYRINNNLNSVIAELNSAFSNTVSNKFQIGYSAFRDFRETPTSSTLMPLVDIANGSGSFLTAFGYEPFSAYNILNSNVFQLSDQLDIYKGKHSLTFGTYNEFYHFENGFDPFFYGAYQFNSLADFYASAAGTVGKVRQYQLGYAANETGQFPLVAINAFQLGLYGQDKIQFNDRFTGTFGLRADMPHISNDLPLNDPASQLSFRDGQQVLTNQFQKNSLLWSPRIGFNWDVKGDRTTQVRGGSGIFTGRVPYVWISNQASNNGILFGSQLYSTANATAAGIVFNPDVNAYRPVGAAAPAPANNPNPAVTYNLAVTDKNFKFPQVWRTNLAVDQVLGTGFTGSFDVALTKDLNAVYHQNINLPAAPNTMGGADNRPIWYKTFPVAPPATGSPSNSTANTRLNTKVTDAILMKNTNKGYSYFITAQLRKTFDFGLYATAAYTYTDARSVNDGGSIAQSIWRDRYISGDPNSNTTSYFNNLTQHRVLVSLNYRKQYAGFMATTVGAIFQAAPAGRFSYVYAGDVNGDNSTGNNDLLYIPAQQSDINLIDITNADGSKYTAAQQWSDLDTYINQDKYLSAHRGQYAERNGAVQPWRGQLDVRLLQDFYIEMANGKRNTLQISVDIFNFGNMLNSNWGVYQTPNRSALLTFKGYDASMTPIYQFPYLNATDKTPLTKSFRDDLGLLSRWQMQLGLRYIFN
jgi:hypothetical protein